MMKENDEQLIDALIDRADNLPERKCGDEGISILKDAIATAKEIFGESMHVERLVQIISDYARLASQRSIKRHLREALDGMRDNLPIYCQFCNKEIRKELQNYKPCPLCKKSILFECEVCHRAVIHKDYSPEEIKANMNKPDLSENSRAEDAYNAMKAAERGRNLPQWWKYHK